MRKESTSELVVALRAECDALCSLKPIYEAEKDALIHNKPERLLDLAVSKAHALDKLRTATRARANVFVNAGVLADTVNATALFIKSGNKSAQQLWQDIRAMKYSLSILHRVVASLLKSRQAAVERAIAVLTTSRNGKDLYSQSGSTLSINHPRSGIAV
jgi:flagellar biosynthesis/type III secretory pathway chaperone